MGLIQLCEFSVDGVPGPQGSKRHVGGGRMIESSAKVKPWRVSVEWRAKEAMAGRSPSFNPIYLDVTFYFPRPASVSVKKRPHHSVKPDLSKLVRSTEDAMTGIVYRDDAQICTMLIAKMYTDDGSSGALIKIREYTQGVA